MMGNGIRNRGGLLLLNRFKMVSVWVCLGRKFNLSVQIHHEFVQLHAMFSTLVPTFGICASWHLPRKGYKNPKKYDGPLDTGNQHSDAFELF